MRGGNEEPTKTELSIIEAEWPQIEAELDGLDLELELLGRNPSELKIRRVRRTVRRLLAAHREQVTEGRGTRRGLRAAA